MFHLDFEDLNKSIEEICSGEKIICAESEREGPQYFLLRYPSKHEIRLSELEFEKSIKQAVKDKFPTEQELLDQIKQRGIWTDDDEKRVKVLKEQIDARKKKLQDPDFSEDAKVYLEEAISKFEEQIFTIEIKKERLLQHSMERKARQAKYDWLVWCCSYDPYNRERVWDNYLTYFKSVSAEIKSILLTELLKFISGKSQEEVRFIARSNLWRVNYLSATKSNSPLFGRSVYDFTVDQLNLVWWSSYYDSIYQMLPEDQPPDYIIENDSNLDKYMEELHKERSQERAARRDAKRKGPNSAMSMQEVLVMRSHPDYQNLEYDAPPTTGTKVTKTLADDPRNRGRLRKLAKGIAKIKQYKKDG